MDNPILSKEMLNYFMQLNDVERKSILEIIKSFLNKRKNEITPQSQSEYSLQLEQADAEIETGNYMTHDEVLKLYLNR